MDASSRLESNRERRRESLLYARSHNRIPRFDGHAALYWGPRALALPHRGSKGFDKADAMRLISAHYAADFESLLFLHHFDRVRSCRDHCCPKGRSRFNPELVALRGWKLDVCPGHANLSRYTHQNVRPCPCAGSSPHKFC